LAGLTQAAEGFGGVVACPVGRFRREPGPATRPDGFTAGPGAEGFGGVVADPAATLSSRLGPVRGWRFRRAVAQALRA
jgi:hypothetical protein